MFINRRPYNINHIPDKLNYKYISKNRNISRERKSPQPRNKEDISDCCRLYIEELNKWAEPLFLEGTSIEDDKPEIKLFSRKETFEEKIERLEQQPLEIFEVPTWEDIDNLNLINNFLYHGIRFQENLEKLEKIFKNRAILAGNYQENYYFSYDDNCNEGEYISLASIEDGYDLVYETFIMPNISLVISPACNAIKTIYLSYDEWEQIKDLETKNRYSYASNEYQVKQIIPIEMVKAIGLPARYLRLTNQEHLIEVYQNDILALMEKYDIELPIVDTSNYNRSLYLPKNHISNYILKRKQQKTNHINRAV